jgi:hypothetical protein
MSLTAFFSTLAEATRYDPAALIGRLGFEHALFLSAAILLVATLGASFAARSPIELLPIQPNPPPG